MNKALYVPERCFTGLHRSRLAYILMHGKRRDVLLMNILIGRDIELVLTFTFTRPVTVSALFRRSLALHQFVPNSLFSSFTYVGVSPPRPKDAQAIIAILLSCVSAATRRGRCLSICLPKHSSIKACLMSQLTSA